jgi:DNA-binding NtrC family response regulator
MEPNVMPVVYPRHFGGNGMLELEKDILIVDDEPRVCEVLGGTLKEAGYRVDLAATACEARHLLDEYRYGMVVADWRLPDGDGTAIANLAAEAGSFSFVMSGYLAEMLPGYYDPRQTFMKPVRPSELLATARACIGKARSRRSLNGNET